MSGRYLYDQKCDQVRNLWRVNVNYSEKTVKEDYDRKMRNLKDKATFQARKNETDIQKCVTLFKKNGHKKNGWKLAVYNTLIKTSYEQSKLTRDIREQHGSKLWNGKRDRELLNIDDKVRAPKNSSQMVE